MIKYVPAPTNELADYRRVICETVNYAVQCRKARNLSRERFTTIQQSLWCLDSSDEAEWTV